jgi:hypothetical protein
MATADDYNLLHARFPVEVSEISSCLRNKNKIQATILIHLHVLDKKIASVPAQEQTAFRNMYVLLQLRHHFMYNI